MKKVIDCLLAFLCFVALSTTAEAQEKKTLSGAVKDNAGDPLAGATISEKGTSNSVLSNENGTFTIQVAPNATLVVS
jgi:hypothetical protein